MTQSELNTILTKHTLWLDSKEGGVRANLKGVDLSRTILRGVELNGAELGRTDLRGANLIGAELIDVNLIGANLMGTLLTKADLNGAKLRRADLKGADLSFADLSRAKLNRANLRRANLGRAKLIDADLTGANLDRANFSGANLTGAKLPKIFANKEQEMLEAARILAIVEQDPRRLDMENWKGRHPECGTTHCIAGWCRPDLEYPAVEATFKLPTLTKYFYCNSAETAIAALKRVAEGKESIYN